jgi:FkbM family methyltransferase
LISSFREGGQGRERLRDLVAKIVSTSVGLRLMNRIYNALGKRGKRRLFLLFARNYRSSNRPSPAGDWRVSLPDGGALVVPIRPDSAWLDWALALSSLGNDQEVKFTYATLLRGVDRPDQFIDVGSNYGSHSLMMMTAGVPTLSFEPNPACTAYFAKWAERNRLKPNVEPVALGNRHGEASFDYPPRATWLGIISRDEKVPPGYQRIRVPIRKLDDYREDLAPGKLLIKLDAEGAEPDIIRGAEKLITERRPMIIFECWVNESFRREMLDAFAGRFALHRLPWLSSRAALTGEQFLRENGTNFLAIPI